MSQTPRSSIGVHVGNDQVAELHGAHAAPIRAAIERWGADTKTLCADADLLGATAATAHLYLFIPTPADK